MTAKKSTRQKTKNYSSGTIIGGAVGIVVAAGASGYVLGAVTSQDIQDFEPRYTISSSELKQTRDELSHLVIRVSDDGVPDYDSKAMPGWSDVDQDGCPTRYDILIRDLLNETVDESSCQVKTGAMFDYYTGNILKYNRLVKGGGIDIDHIVAKGDAWLSGGYDWNTEQWKTYINDEDVLMATSSSINRKKGDKNAAEWLPPNEAYHCLYVNKQVSIKTKYNLSVSETEQTAFKEALDTKCTTD